MKEVLEDDDVTDFERARDEVLEGSSRCVRRSGGRRYSFVICGLGSYHCVSISNWQWGLVSRRRSALSHSWHKESSTYDDDRAPRQAETRPESAIPTSTERNKRVGHVTGCDHS